MSHACLTLHLARTALSLLFVGVGILLMHTSFETSLSETFSSIVSLFRRSYSCGLELQPFSLCWGSLLLGSDLAWRAFRRDRLFGRRSGISRCGTVFKTRRQLAIEEPRPALQGVLLYSIHSYVYPEGDPLRLLQ